MVKRLALDLAPNERLLVAVAQQAALDASPSKTLVGLSGVAPAQREAVRREASEFLLFLAAELHAATGEDGAHWRKMARG